MDETTTVNYLAKFQAGDGEWIVAFSGEDESDIKHLGSQLDYPVRYFRETVTEVEIP